MDPQLYMYYEPLHLFPVIFSPLYTHTVYTAIWIQY